MNPAGILTLPYRWFGPDRTFWTWIICALVGYLTFDGMLLFVLNPTPLEIDFSELSKERFALRRWVRVFGVELGPVERPTSEGILVDRNAVYGFDLDSFQPGQSTPTDLAFDGLVDLIVRLNDQQRNERRPREFALLLLQPARVRPEDQRGPGILHIHLQMARDMLPVFASTENRGRGFYEGMLEDLDPDLKQAYDGLDLEFASQALRCGVRPSATEAGVFGGALFVSLLLLVGFLKEGVEDEAEQEETAEPLPEQLLTPALEGPATRTIALKQGRKRTRQPRVVQWKDRTRRASRPGFRPK